MARGSFGYSPARGYAVKLRWIVASLSGVVAVLLVLLVSLLQRNSHEPPVSITDPGSAYAAPLAQTQILVARTRIESGMELNENLVEAKLMMNSEIPPGALRINEKHRLAGTFATQLIPLGPPIFGEYITNQPPMRLQDIPAGFRAVTISLDSRERVAGHVKPFSRVDVNCVYTDRDGVKKLGTVVTFVKVFSVGGCTRPEECQQAGGDGVSTVTLVVSERDARKIELARTLGTLSLSLVGDGAIGSGESTIVTPRDLFNTPDEPAEEPVSGCIEFREFGRSVRKCLTKKGWNIVNREKS